MSCLSIPTLTNGSANPRRVERGGCLARHRVSQPRRVVPGAGQDGAYGALLREPRRALHAYIAETLDRQFAEIADNQPELLAHHFTQAGLTEAAIEWWGKAGQRSLARSALPEGAEQVKREAIRNKSQQNRGGPTIFRPLTCRDS
jgi:hypothetical protein